MKSSFLLICLWFPKGPPCIIYDSQDYTADEELIHHGFAADGKDAARLAFTAGVDMSMQSGL